MPRSPTTPRFFWPILFGVPLALFAAVLLHAARTLPATAARYLAVHPDLRAPAIETGAVGLVNAFVWCAGTVATLCLAACLLSFVRRGWALHGVRAAYLAVLAVCAFEIYAVFRVTAPILAQNIVHDGVTPTQTTLFDWRLAWMWPAFLAAVFAGFFDLLAWRGRVIALYTGRDRAQPAAGDRVLENLRTHGEDPRFRKGLWSSIGLHLLVIFVIPWLLGLPGCVKRYTVPKGSGTPEVAVAKIVKVVKKQKKKHLLVNARSAISFYVPDLDDSKVLQKVDADTQVTYQADPNRVASMLGAARAGRMGAGGGKEGGWPDGMDNAVVRFIRLEYNGAGWDDGMDAASRAELNFLDAFHTLTGFKVASQTESHSITLLRKYPKGYAPPFVYMTGREDIHVSESDLRTLRAYLLDGGMLFADCGSPRWNNSFHAFVQRLFPGEPLLTIADDDPLFQIPYAFPNGAPPLWHHGGYRALGVKHEGRWVLFYYPGNICDAWKTGHSGMDPALAEGATQMGVNIVYYAFTHYLDVTRKERQ